MHTRTHIVWSHTFTQRMLKGMGLLMFYLTARTLSTQELEQRLAQYLTYLARGYRVTREVTIIERQLIRRGANLAV